MDIYVSCVIRVEATNAMTWKLAVSVVPLVPESEDADSLYVKMSFKLDDKNPSSKNGKTRQQKNRRHEHHGTVQAHSRKDDPCGKEGPN